MTRAAARGPEPASPPGGSPVPSPRPEDHPVPLPALRYGLAGAVPAEATGSWGCRAIVTQQGEVDLVPDRIDRQGTRLILDLLNERYSPAELTAAIGGLLRSGRMSTRRRERFEIHASATLTIAADTLASAGYCYIAAWTTTVPGARP